MMMKVVCLLAVVATVQSAKVQSKVSPIEKVMELIKNLQSEVEAEGVAEATAYDKYACFCKEQADEKLYMIEKSTKKIAKLDAKIKDLEADITELNAAIKDLATEIERLTNEIDEAAAARAKAHAEYKVVDADTVGAIGAIEGAIAALKGAKDDMADNGVKTDFAQVKAVATQLLAVAASSVNVVPQEQVNNLVTLSQLDQPAYESRSGGILQTLEEFKDTFNENKKQDDEEEDAANAAWEKKDLNLKKVKKFSEDEKKQKEQFVEAKTETMQKAQVDQVNEIKDKAADNSFMELLTEECENKAKQFDQRGKTRTGELTALAGALAALAEKVAPSAGANKKLAGVQEAVSLLQLRGSRSESSARATSIRASQFLADAASRIDSSVLALAAARAEASADHFVKVRQIIKDLVAKLEADAKAEADQKAFCDTAMSENVEQRDTAVAEVEGLTSTKSQLTSEDAQLNKEITELSTDIAALQKGLKEATELREEEKVENENTLATAEEGRAGTELALKILNEFYAAAGGSFVQFVPEGAGADGKTVGDMAPDSPDGEYKGNQEKSKGIVGMLEVILSDFERTLQKVTEEEKTAQDEFDEYQTKTQADLDAKGASKTTKEDRVNAIADELVAASESLKENQDLLSTAKKALEGLKAQCVSDPMSYEDKVAKRKKEIEALKEAHQILEDWNN